jgi:hypothetical protein
MYALSTKLGCYPQGVFYFNAQIQQVLLLQSAPEVVQQVINNPQPYDHLNIAGVKGLTDDAIATLKALGAVEDNQNRLMLY